MNRGLKNYGSSDCSLCFMSIARKKLAGILYFSTQTPEADWKPRPNFGRSSEINFVLKMTFRRIRRVAPYFILSFITNLESNLQILRILEINLTICWREIHIFLAHSESPCHRFGLIPVWPRHSKKDNFFRKIAPNI